MKYMLLIYSNPEVWDALRPDEREALGSGHAELTKALLASGEFVSGSGLQGPERSRTVRVRDGIAATTDGPFAEAKEHLAGYYLVDCADSARAEEIAASMPDAKLVGIEVRPVMDG